MLPLYVLHPRNLRKQFIRANSISVVCLCDEAKGVSRPFCVAGVKLVIPIKPSLKLQKGEELHRHCLLVLAYRCVE